MGKRSNGGCGSDRVGSVASTLRLVLKHVGSSRRESAKKTVETLEPGILVPTRLFAVVAKMCLFVAIRVLMITVIIMMCVWM